MNVCTRRLDWRDHPPHDADSCCCAPEIRLTTEQARQMQVEWAIEDLVRSLEDFNLEDLKGFRALLDAEIAAR